jgi:hypothetical protein
MNFVGRERCLDCNCLRSPKKHLFAVWILLCITRDPKYTNSLTTSKVLSPEAQRRESSCRCRPQSYFFFLLYCENGKQKFGLFQFLRPRSRNFVMSCPTTFLDLGLRNSKISVCRFRYSTHLFIDENIDRLFQGMLL